MSSNTRARASLVLTVQAFCGTIKGNFSPRAHSFSDCKHSDKTTSNSPLNSVSLIGEDFCTAIGYFGRGQKGRKTQSRRPSSIASAGSFFPPVRPCALPPYTTAARLKSHAVAHSPPLKHTSTALYVCLKATKLSSSYLLDEDADRKHLLLSVKRLTP